MSRKAFNILMVALVVMLIVIGVTTCSIANQAEHELQKIDEFIAEYEGR